MSALSHLYRCLVLAASMLAFAAPAAAAIDITLMPLKTSSARGDDVLVRVTLSNTSGTPQYLLRWRTPVDGVQAPLFEVRRDGQPVRYLGRLVKRAAPVAADYLRLEPGAAVTKMVELSALYEMNITGSYTIRYRSPAVPATAPALQPLAGELVSNAVSIWVEGRLPRGSKGQATAPASTAEPAPAWLSASVRMPSRSSWSRRWKPAAR